MHCLLAALLLAAALAACGDRSANVRAVPATTTEQAGTPQSAEYKAETARLNEWFAARWEDALETGGKIDAEKADELREATRQAILESFNPSYDALISWFESDLPNTDAEASGVGALPRGLEYYDERLAFATTTEMTADEVHKYGLAEVARIQSEMEAIKESVGFEGTLQEFFVFLREDPQFFQCLC